MDDKPAKKYKCSEAQRESLAKAREARKTKALEKNKLILDQVRDIIEKPSKVETITAPPVEEEEEEPEVIIKRIVKKKKPKTVIIEEIEESSDDDPPPVKKLIPKKTKKPSPSTPDPPSTPDTETPPDDSITTKIKMPAKLSPFARAIRVL